MPEAAGHTYEELDPELQSKFITFSLGFDSLVDTSPSEIREVFRRMNSYDFPLNYEEQRHSRFQGAFKWLVYRIAREYGERLKAFGTFTETNLVRMADMKLIAEIAHAFDHSITTTNKRSLDALYKAFEREYPKADADFERGEDFSEKLGSAVDLVLSMSSLAKTKITRPYSMYSLLLALMHAEHEIPALSEIAAGGRGLRDLTDMERSLGEIADALRTDVGEAEDDGFERLREAFSSRTNVKDQRETRFVAYLDAVGL